uniref:Uncharacterized protein n=2 Tax=Aegilops tauschii subsp. strangulata TaxID=200361 RepID=A0A453B517_AEGTS
MQEDRTGPPITQMGPKGLDLGQRRCFGPAHWPAYNPDGPKGPDLGRGRRVGPAHRRPHYRTGPPITQMGPKGPDLGRGRRVGTAHRRPLPNRPAYNPDGPKGPDLGRGRRVGPAHRRPLPKRPAYNPDGAQGPKSGPGATRRTGSPAATTSPPRGSTTADKPPGDRWTACRPSSTAIQTHPPVGGQDTWGREIPAPPTPPGRRQGGAGEDGR